MSDDAPGSPAERGRGRWVPAGRLASPDYGEPPPGLEPAQRALWQEAMSVHRVEEFARWVCGHHQEGTTMRAEWTRWLAADVLTSFASYPPGPLSDPEFLARCACVVCSGPFTAGNGLGCVAGRDGAVHLEVLHANCAKEIREEQDRRARQHRRDWDRAYEEARQRIGRLPKAEHRAEAPRRPERPPARPRRPRPEDGATGAVRSQP